MDVFILILFIAILIFSVVLHEVSHGAMANALGDPTARAAGRLTLNPIPHIDIVGSIIVPGSLLMLSALTGGFAPIFGWAKPVPYNPFNFNKFRKWGSAIVAVVGPATNILIAVVAGVSLRFIVNNMEITGGLEGVVVALAITTMLNVVLAVFNMVPIPPLDGSKVLFSAFNISPNTQMFLEQNGFIFLLLFIFLGFPIIIPIISGIFTLITGVPMGAFIG